ncbi:MAG: energy-coupling factor transporter transmembrane component T [Anaerovoracaceae bacterium]
MSKDVFTTYNPIINFVFFMGAVVLGMFFVHPAFLACSLLLSFSYYLTVRGSRGLKFVLGMIPLFLVLSAINPLFNTSGATVLFTYLGGRAYTLEALFYGMAVAAMFVSIMTWFASYNAVMTSDKFLYIFGKAAPSVSLVLSAVLRLIPSFQRKAVQIAGARKCIGKAGDAGTRREKIENGMTVLSTLTTWALEGGIVTADSMRSRGYGSGRRTNFAIYRFDKRDVFLVIFMSFLIAAVMICAFFGGTKVSYTPVVEIAGMDNIYTIAGTIAYFIFLAIPTVLNITEEITWRILRSRI